MSIRIDEFSVKPLFLESYSNGTKLGGATGFVVKKDDSSYLITNWHVVTCRDPYNDRLLSQTGLTPTVSRIWFHQPLLGHWVQKEISLFDEDGNEIWLEHEQGKEIDVVALPFDVTDDMKIYDMGLELADFDLMLYPSEAVSIIGYPLGISSGGKLPIWKTGYIASDINIDWDDKPAFLIDATTKGGMSGSPVIAKRISIYQTSKGNQIGNAVKFLGVYSGREISPSGIEVGVVWKPGVISDILAEQ